MQETQGREDPLEEDMTTTPVLLPGEPHGQRSLVGYTPWGRTASATTKVTEQQREPQWGCMGEV